MVRMIQRLWGEARSLAATYGWATMGQIVAQRATRIGQALAAGRGADAGTFVRAAYRTILAREGDAHGVRHYEQRLAAGGARLGVAYELAASAEFLDKMLKARAPQATITPIVGLRPAQYREQPTLPAGDPVLVFEAQGDEDFDWLERMILEHGYYEKDGVWGIVIDTDKRVMAEILASFRPRRVLEIGCANGTVVQCLYEKGVHCEGVEISQLAIQRAFPAIRGNIHHGDLLALDFPQRYDLVFGLDIFEHLNPQKLERYIQRLYDLLDEGGFLFGNIPVFGPDPLFGTVFEPYLPQWEADLKAGQRFMALHVDHAGYPINGHLVWAGTDWWVAQFERVGFQRVPDIEAALHEKYDRYMEATSTARKSYYVFGKQPRAEAVATIASHIRTTPSQVLAGIVLED